MSFLSKLFSNQPPKIRSNTRIKNESLRAISTRFRGSKDDTVFVTTSRICPECSKYNRRIFSVYGRYKSFPILPHFLYTDRCPLCNTSIGYAHYFPGITGNLKQDIRDNQKTIEDKRNIEERKLWNEHIEKQNFNIESEEDYKWIVNNLPELAPKSIAGYKKMRISNSKNYQQIVSAALEKGYTIR